MNPIEFQYKEQEIFLSNSYSAKEIGLMLQNFNPSDYFSVLLATKKGLEIGVEEFLKSHDKAQTIYESQDLREFTFDDSTGIAVASHIMGLELNLGNIPEFARDVCKSYSLFAYNESYERFKKEFDE